VRPVILKQEASVGSSFISLDRLAREGSRTKRRLEEIELIQIEEKKMNTRVNDQNTSQTKESTGESERKRPKNAHQKKEEEIDRIEDTWAKE
jgi:hypothetical protein